MQKPNYLSELEWTLLQQFGDSKYPITYKEAFNNFRIGDDDSSAFLKRLGTLLRHKLIVIANATVQGGIDYMLGDEGEKALGKYISVINVSNWFK